MLHSFGYLSVISHANSYKTFSLTSKAFQLLERRSTPPTVFISYKRDCSSAFGLLVEFRLQAIGVKAFLDRSIDPGEEWHAQLEAKIRQSKCFIALLAPKTLESPYVRREIEWALDEKILLIPVWHSGFTEANLPDDWKVLGGKQAIHVQQESAEAYHDAVEKLLNRLGYVTP